MNPEDLMIYSKLEDLVSLKSISTDSAYRSDVEQAASYIESLLNSLNFFNVSQKKTANSLPTVFGSIGSSKRSVKRIVVYTHYDVQPIFKESSWKTDPFKLTKFNDRLYARGVADSKVNVIAFMFGFLKAKASGLLENVRVDFILEGEEEIGSPFLRGYLASLNENSYKDATIIIADQTSNHSTTKPCLTLSLRGSMELVIKVKAGDNNLHSGHYGGLVVNPALWLCTLLADAHSSDGLTLNIPGIIQDEIILPAGLIDLLKNQSEYLNSRTIFNGWKLHEVKNLSPVIRLGFVSTLEITGFSSGFMGEGVLGIVPSYAEAKILCRVAPKVSSTSSDCIFSFSQVGVAEKAMQSISDWIQSRIPQELDVEFSFNTPKDPVLLNPQSEGLKLAKEALKKSYGSYPIFESYGASIPIIPSFQRLTSDIVQIGFGTKKSNPHGANESVDSEALNRGIKTVLEFCKML